MFTLQTEEKPLALASALTYWVFRCRDKHRSPANGIKTWEYLQSSVSNAAIPSRGLNDYLVQLSTKLITPTLKPAELRRLIIPNQVVLRATRNEDGSLDELVQTDKDQVLGWQSWDSIIKQWSIEFGITERHVLKECKEKAQLVVLYCRLKHEEDKLLWVKEIEEDEVTIDV